MSHTVPVSARLAPHSARIAPWRTLVAFHMAAGARAALRVGAIGVAVVLFAFGSTPGDLGPVPRPNYTLLTVVRAFVAREPSTGSGLLGRNPLGARLLVAILAGALSGLGARRVTLGATGWMRSLPASAVTTRRAAWMVAGLTALPAAIFPALALAPAIGLYHLPLDMTKLVALPLLLASAAAVATPVEHRETRAFAGLAFVGAAWATWPTLTFAATALATWDRWAGGLRGLRQVRGVRHGLDARMMHAPWLSPHLAALALAVRWAWRAAGWRAWTYGVAAAALPVSLGAFAQVNNGDLASATRAWVARLGIAVGVVAYVACGAAALLARRTPWPWVRTLPWSAADRILVDTFVLAVPAAGVGITAALGLSLATPALRSVGAPGVATAAVAGLAGVAVVTAALAALAAAGAVRVGAARQTGAVGELALVGLPTAVALALRPTLALLAPAVAVALGALAVRRERRAAGALRWNELRHDVAGDVGWIARV